MPHERRLFAVAGLVTALAGLAVSELVATLLHASVSPVVAVASAVRDLTPGAVALPLIHLVKHLDKPLLIAGSVVVVCVVAAWATARGWGRGALIVLAVIAAAAIAFEHGGMAAYVALVAGLVVWLLVLPMLTRPSEPPADRRAFLRAAGSMVVLSAGALVVACVAGRSQRAVQAARATLGRTLRAPLGTEPARASLGVPGVAPWRTPNPDFYRIDTLFTPPAVDPTTWRLRIHGMVERELTVTYDELVGRGLTGAWITLCCVSNPVGGPLISNAYFGGVPIRELLKEAGVKPGADAVLQTSVDGWTCGTPLAAVTDGRNALLALTMNGQPLPIEHGFPVRMVVPGLYGYVSATKWLVDLQVTRFSDFSAYWTERGWSVRGPVKTESRIDVPRDGAGVAAGEVRVGGSAWAQHTGIAKVEYAVDGGPWLPADLGGVAGLDTWVQWSGRVSVAPGPHRLVVRATDRSGYTQTPVPHDVVPDGATGWHTVGFTAS